MRRLCLEGLVPVLLAAGAPLEDGEDIAAVLEHLVDAPLWRDAVRREHIERAYSALHEATKALARVLPELGQQPLWETSAYLLPEGLEAGYSVQWDHLIRMRPALEQLAAELPRMEQFDWSHPAGATLPEMVLLNCSHELPGGELALMPLGSLGRPLTLRELAMVTLLVGGWPELKAGDTGSTVVSRVTETLRITAKRLGISLSNGGTN